jgi:hypothetical protein
VHVGGRDGVRVGVLVGVAAGAEDRAGVDAHHPVGDRPGGAGLRVATGEGDHLADLDPVDRSGPLDHHVAGRERRHHAGREHGERPATGQRRQPAEGHREPDRDQHQQPEHRPGERPQAARGTALSGLR